jgi:hypothetical protein
MSDYIYLEDDNDDNYSGESTSEDTTSFSAIVESLEELFQTKSELDEVLESVYVDLINFCDKREDELLEVIANLKAENDALKLIIDDKNLSIN